MTFRKICSQLAILSIVALTTQAVLAEDHHKGPHWGYQGAGNPDKWGDLSKEFATCKLGKEQSPIDIKTKDIVKGKPEKLEFSYKPTALNVVNNGHTIQINYEKGSFLKVGKQQYELVQFHFHTTGEEKIDGKEFDLNAHLVHKNAEGKLAVVSVLFDKGSENAFLKNFWDKLPRKAGEKLDLPKTSINVQDILPANKTYYTFTGSLTTPPCTEGVRWFVLKTPVTLSKEQADAFKALYPINNRPVQPLNKRVVQEGS